MASLAHVIRDYQSGGLTRDEFIARLDNTLTTDSLSPARMMDVLDEAHARSPLPADLHAEVRRRIEQLPVSNLAAGGEETRLQTRQQAHVDAPSHGSSSMGTAGPLPAFARTGFSDAMSQAMLLPAVVLVVGFVAVLFYELPRHLAKRSEPAPDSVAAPA